MSTKETEKIERDKEIMAVKAMLEYAFFSAKEVGAENLAAAIRLANVEAELELQPKTFKLQSAL